MTEGFPHAAVLWDIDGTLADSEPLHLETFRRVAASVGVTLPEDFHERTVGRSEEMSLGLLQSDYGLPLGMAEWTKRRFADYISHAPEIPAIPETLALWHRLAALGVAQALVSNSDRMIVAANIATLGLERPGLVSVTRNDVVQGKPAPEPYLRAALLLGVAPEACAVVEDSATGMRAGLAAGATVYAVPHAEGDLLEGVRPLADLLARLPEDQTA
ncbi:HAD family phosphatase [Pseudooceanicola sp. CBS1P-1]|uniref:HAD-IA family hydrolase n=1 Tax=Pseudooceanicola albus TaxID=2692189 RepID=A0A6L7G5Q4_9RHOB|nr:MULTISPECIES: HAD family phosphatase [Pseudooceanicola]MBT9385013.1 HAD family phosphatase [Pseudooceanicola endophyticus]MXN17993.1 HAD-IA family hydrolase [Pseudooceanicola albus]